MSRNHGLATSEPTIEDCPGSISLLGLASPYEAHEVFHSGKSQSQPLLLLMFEEKVISVGKVKVIAIVNPTY